MSANPNLSWDLPRPHILRVRASADDIDIFGHVNNAVYLKWADEVAWDHWQSAGYGQDDCRALDRGMAIIRTEADYLGHVREGDELDCAVWIAASDGRLRAERWYQFNHASTGQCVFRARTWLVCFQLSTGRPARLIGAFKDHYASPEGELASAVAALQNHAR